MPTNLTIVHPEDFVRATQTGAVDVVGSRELLRQIVSRLKATGVHHVLIDLRQTTPGQHLSKSELFELGVAFGTQSALARGRIALLVSFDKEIDAEFFESVARVHGTNVRAFTEFESAITWLAMRESRV
jgi:hypothetical protein